jgi:hypothetical protein
MGSNFDFGFSFIALSGFMNYSFQLRAFPLPSSQRQRKKTILFSAIFAPLATCRVVARRAKPEAGGLFLLPYPQSIVWAISIA